MDNFQNIKAFNAAAQNYLKRPNQTTASVLQQCLDMIIKTTDLKIFDTISPVTKEFYLHLHNLVISSDSSSPPIWSVIEVLQHLCNSPQASQQLIHTYKFASIVSKLLVPDLVSLKRVKVLKVLQELTYGIRIPYQERYLFSLILTLTQWIIESNEEEIVNLSVGVLINVCYKNLPSIYTLLKKTDIKALHRKLLVLQNGSISIRVQCCKLLIMMEQVTKTIPDQLIFEFVVVTMQNLLTVLQNQDTSVLRHLVEFFEDVRLDESSRTALASYADYARDVKTIIKHLKTSAPESVALVIEFFQSLVKLKHPTLIPLYPELIKIAMTWIADDLVAVKAMGLLRVIISNSRLNKNISELTANIKLDTLMLVLGPDDDSDPKYLDVEKRLTEFVKLMLEINKVKSFRGQVSSEFSVQRMKKLLLPVLATNDGPRNLRCEPTQAFYIHALALTVELAIQDSNWLALYTALMEERSVQMTIAVAVFTGDAEVKQTALQLISSANCPQECISAVAKCMCELVPLALIESQSTYQNLNACDSQLSSAINASADASFTLAQENELDTLLGSINDLVKENKINEITTSNVIELYQYKLLIMSQNERVNQANLEACNNHATRLQQLLAQTTAESKELYQLLYYSQLNVDLIKDDKVRMSKKLQETEEQSKKLLSTQKLEIASLKKILDEKSKSNEQQAKVLAELKKEKDEWLKERQERDNKETKREAKLLEQANKIAEINKINSKLEDSLGKKNQAIEKVNKELETAQETIAVLQRELKQSNEQSKGYIQTIAEKEEEIGKLHGEVKDLSQMRDMIINLAASKKNNTTT
ncbi:uncharacterized protein LOC103578059 [Microplitis demolitor]|uniref:uncharacterized protein LOC103578059 n=1 Tax=Microplitis demolitor TaxID=69319 RepID=UPI0004CD1FB4|nr:uncharacterized protein LOC103578059 [Microplitis demolitor]XP_008557225.1 uncharacterized protein LOC103578059 [Microplitis demolitor]XP_053598925.1 uncharacterized protein LOC103578059 [Microplitis demolitor]